MPAATAGAGDFLARLGLAHTDPEPEFDRITQLAMYALSCSGSVFTLGDGETVHIKSIAGAQYLGLLERELPAAVTVTPLVAAARAPLVVPDTQSHPMLAHRGPLKVRVRAIAAVPVKDPAGAIVGIMGVGNQTPRDWTPRDVGILTDFADIITRELEFRRQGAGEIHNATQDMARAEASSDVLCVMDRGLRLKEVGARAIEVWGYTPEELQGKRIDELLAAADAATIASRLARVAEGRQLGDFESVCVAKDGSRRTVFWNVMWSASDQSFYAITRNAPSAAPPRQWSASKILVVDDYREIAMLIRTALASAGFANVDMAQSPTKALEMAQGKTYDLVVSDLRMQPMNGVDLFSRVRALPGMETVPFLVISAYASRDVIDRMKSIGVSGFIAKPFTTADLVRHVRRALGQAESVGAFAVG